MTRPLIVALGSAWITQALDLPLALGAFVAGLVISESEYSHQVVDEILPFRDVFNALFFVSDDNHLPVHGAGIRCECQEFVKRYRTAVHEFVDTCLERLLTQ